MELSCSCSCNSTRSSICSCSCSFSFDFAIFEEIIEFFLAYCIFSTYDWNDSIMWELVSGEFESIRDGKTENCEKYPDYNNNTNRVYHIFFILYWSWPDNVLEFITRFFYKIGHKVIEIRNIQKITDKSIWNLLLSSKHFKIRRSGLK